MKKNTTIQDIQHTLEKLFNDLNSEYYNNELPPILITIMKSRHGKELGWATAGEVWHQKENGDSENTNSYYEINICADALHLSINDIAEIMLHEMAHIYNTQHHIIDTSRNGTYHNKRFALTAQAHGLICESTPKNGFAHTELSNQTIDFIKNNQYDELNLVRQNHHIRNGNYLRYVCHSCGAIIRSTKEVHALCLDCNIPFEYEPSRRKSSNKLNV